MDNFQACSLAEGFAEGTPTQVLQAWAYLIKTGLVWTLQGYYGRTAHDLLTGGIIAPNGDILQPDFIIH